jgi:hypothetical protein
VGDTIKLFRGDSTKIKEFKFKETKKWCLLGQGIYLTNNERVAQSYRTKGTSKSRFGCIVRAKTKPEAVEAALKEYHYHYEWNNAGLFQRRRFDDLKQQDLEKLKGLLSDKIEKGEITVTRQGYFQKRDQIWDFHLEEKAPKFGYLTSFEFPEPYFTNNCINIDAVEKDPGFLELLLDCRFWDTSAAPVEAVPNIHWSPKMKQEFIKKEKAKVRVPFYETYIRNYSPVNSFAKIEPRALKFERIIPELKKYGIHGFEYDGGFRLGGTRHRAFSIFDEEFVNDHKVSRYT